MQKDKLMALATTFLYKNEIKLVFPRSQNAEEIHEQVRHRCNMQLSPEFIWAPDWSEPSYQRREGWKGKGFFWCYQLSPGCLTQRLE